MFRAFSEMVGNSILIQRQSLITDFFLFVKLKSAIQIAQFQIK